MPLSPVEPAAGPSLPGRLAAAAGASVAAALLVNPLDVVKTRMQAQATAGLVAALQGGGGGGGAAAVASTSAPALCVGAAGGGATTSLPRPPSPSFTAPSLLRPGPVTIFRTILATEGVRGLWRGVDYALLMSVPMVGVYMPLYDYMLAALEENGRARGHAATTTTNAAQAALAGGAARAVAVLATSPLELARTRAQGLVGNGVCAAGAATPPRPPAPALPKPQGLGALAATRAAWTGAGATLARDVPFSALYWAALEPARRAVLGGMGYSAGGDGGGSTGGSPSLPPPSPGAAAVANLFAGAAAGGAAAAATTPLDVAKTAVQLADAQCAACGGTTSAAAAADARARGVVATLRALHSAGGLPALFAGVGPRAARAAPACAIVVVAYELLKMAAMPGGGHGMHGMHEAADRAARVALAAVEE